LQDKSSGDWHAYYGVNSSPKLVGYFPKSLLPGMIDKPVQLRFGGYVSHEKPTPSPPMGNGNTPSSGLAASVSNIKLIDADGNDHVVNTSLPYYEIERAMLIEDNKSPRLNKPTSIKSCQTLSSVAKKGQNRCQG
jgi:hypothetical protein